MDEIHWRRKLQRIFFIVLVPTRGFCFHNMEETNFLYVECSASFMDVLAPNLFSSQPYILKGF